MATDTPACRLCGSTSVDDRGAIPGSDYFGGRVLQRTLDGGKLWCCRSCRSMFRHPVLDASAYLSLYASAAPTQWAGGDDRCDLALVGAIVGAEHGVHSVLDVGCGTGDFLASLPGRVSRYGVEPSGAKAHAAARGVQIVGASLADVPPTMTFDAITIIDVIEHVPEPGVLLGRAFSLLRPGGIVVVSSGDPETWVWRRVFAARFWYASFPEHVSFPSLRYFELWGTRHGAAVAAKIATRYELLRTPRAVSAPGAPATAPLLRAGRSGALRRSPRRDAQEAAGRHVDRSNHPGTRHGRTESPPGWGAAIGRSTGWPRRSAGSLGGTDGR
jgi:SAM-dependent methyltransferase